MTAEGGGNVTNLTTEQQGAIESVFANLPDSYAERYAMMQSLRRSFYGELAKQLQPALNAYAKIQPKETWEERSALASWINQTLRQMGLVLVCPRTNRPAILISDMTGGSRKKMHFRFQTAEPSGKRVRSAMSVELPDLELMQAPGRIENLAREFRNRGANTRPR
jgi:hypothetical protein